jgi:hypothetical protein
MARVQVLCNSQVRWQHNVVGLHPERHFTLNTLVTLFTPVPAKAAGTLPW